jgi:hypothetical protein
MDLDSQGCRRPHFADRDEYPTAQDVLDAVWLFQDLADAARDSGEVADAERCRDIADAARSEYRRRSQEWSGASGPASSPAAWGAASPSGTARLDAGRSGVAQSSGAPSHGSDHAEG